MCWGICLILIFVCAGRSEDHGSPQQPKAFCWRQNWNARHNISIIQYCKSFASAVALVEKISSATNKLRGLHPVPYSPTSIYFAVYILHFSMDKTFVSPASISGCVKDLLQPRYLSWPGHTLTNNKSVTFFNDRSFLSFFLRLISNSLELHTALFSSLPHIQGLDKTDYLLTS